MQKQALEKIEACRYCDSVRVSQDSVILSQKAEIVSLDSARVNAEERATVKGIEAAALQTVVQKDSVIIGEEKGNTKRLRRQNTGLKILFVLAVAWGTKESLD